MTKICLENLKDNVYQVISCETGKPIDLPTGRIKGKRAPSRYNLHMKDCVPRKTGPITQRFKACADEWRAKKGG